MAAPGLPLLSATTASGIQRPLTFTTLPPEIRLEIYDWVFFSTTVCAECVTSSVHEDVDEETGDDGEDEDTKFNESGEEVHHEHGMGEPIANQMLDTHRGRDKEAEIEIDGGAPEGENDTADDRGEKDGEANDSTANQARVAAASHDAHAGTTDEGDNHSVEEADVSREIPLTPIPDMPVKLNLVSRLLNTEIVQSWHSKVTYWFPSTVAFADVLGQWSQNKLEALRHAHIVAYPLPLYPIGEPTSYMTHFGHDALPIFPGLQLDLLTIEDVWLLPDGKEVEGFCLDATRNSVLCALLSLGWKELNYLSGPLGLLSRWTKDIDERIEAMKKKRAEEAFEYAIRPSRPQLSGIVSYTAGDVATEQDTPEDKAEVKAWDAQHKDDASVQLTQKAVQAWAKRGTEQYAETGEGRSKFLKGLLEEMTWVELRASGKYLVDDGMGEDYTAHL